MTRPAVLGGHSTSARRAPSAEETIRYTSTAPRKRPGRLAWHLMMPIVAIAFPLICINAAVIWSGYRAERGRAEAQLVDYARSLSRLVDREFDRTQAVGQFLARSTARKSGDQTEFEHELHVAAEVLAAGLPSNADEPLANSRDANGHLLSTTSGVRPNKNPVGLPHILSTLQTGEPTVSDLFNSLRSGIPRVAIAIPVFDDSDNPRGVVGVISVTVPRERLLAIVNEAGLPPGAVVSIQDRRGVTVARSFRDLETLGASPIPAMVDAAAERGAGVLASSVSTLDEVVSIVAFARAPISHYIVEIDVPRDALLSPLRVTLLRAIALGIIATVCILPANDGYVAISPREDRQWAAWLEAMGSPAWGAEPRFATKQDRAANWDALHALMCEWSRDKGKHRIATIAQAAHVPSFPLCEPFEHLASPQLRHRDFFRSVAIAGKTVPMPGSPFGAALSAGSRCESSNGPLPLSGIRVLDFSWVIAGPTATRYLAAMGAEIIKIEAPGRGDPGRASELHTVLGQAKKSIVLDLKRPDAIAAAKALAATADVLVENFATGVMDRLGLGVETLRAINPDLIYVSASGLGRTGPEAGAVAYGTLLQSYAGFAGLNRHAGMPPRVGMAWLDPMCGLMLAFITAASVWRRRSGHVARIDFSMMEAMLWTMAEPLLGACEAGRGKVVKQDGSDDWTASETTAAGEKAISALARSGELVACPHLRSREFWDDHAAGVLPGLPWRASFGRATGPAPELGADTVSVLGSLRV